MPLTVGAIVRAIWLRYRITDRRISITGGWMGNDRTDIIYGEIVKIAKIPRGIGLWGDLVVTLRDYSPITSKINTRTEITLMLLIPPIE